MQQNCLATPSNEAVDVKWFAVFFRIVVMCRFLQNAKESYKMCYNLQIAINHVKFSDVKN
jgi:hypothetical protein